MKIVGIILLICLAALLILFVWSKSKRSEIKSFWDVVRNPSLMPDLDGFHKRVENSASAISGSENEVNELVDYFVFKAKSSNDAWTEKRIIAKLGEEAYPRALAILRDESMQDDLVVLSDDESSLLEAPICRLSEIFDQNAPPPPESAELLAPFLRSDSAEIRKSVALIIGSVGSSKSLPILERALEDEDGYVKSYALMGIQRAIKGGRISQSEKSHFFDLVAEMWPQDTSFEVSDSIPKILLDLDRERAIERLLEPDLFTAKFEPVWRILEAFAEGAVEVPRQKLLSIFEQIGDEPIEYPMDNILAGTIALLGQHRNDEDQPLLERLLDHENEKVSSGAIEGLRSFYRYSEVVRDPWDVLEADGWNALSEVEKYIIAVEELDLEVNNGGFAQYYFNSAGNRWVYAQSGLEAIGATTRREIMVATIEKFGKTEPSSTRDSRSLQLSTIVRRKEDPFADQDTAWYETEGELLELLIFRYNLANLKGRK